MNSDDDSVFNDDLDDSEITNLIHNIPLSLSLSLSLKSKLQRNLYGEIIPQQYIEIDTSKGYTELPPTHHVLDYENLSTYIYPTNFEIRDYQFNIVQRAFYDNLLVALPTGLGKTFIASTVMLNFTRWFPQGKIIFMAPTKPLVAQQIKACCGITGIPTSQVAILLDKSRRNRTDIWNSKTVFFTTPQVVENDLTTGIIDPKLVVLLVIDEAHKSKGNYAYNNVVKFITRFSNSFRILALTATPASDVEGVQEIIDNLSISKVEVRTEQSIDISKYMKRKTIERVTVSPSIEICEIVDMLCTAIQPVLSMANERRIYDMTDPLKINAFQVIDASQRLLKNPTIPEGLKWQNYFILQILNVVGQSLRRLNIYGIKSFYNYFDQKHKEFTTKYNNKKSTNQTAARFYFHENINLILSTCRELISNDNYLGHPKLEVLINELDGFFKENEENDSRVIIFTEFRESALDIVNSIERIGSNLKPHIFIGQSKEKEKFDEETYLSKGKKSKAKGKATKGKQKNTETSERSTSRTSSEDAQIKGMNQKLQKELIKKFKKGEYNILVATSIGEEGLDIGEVDLIICYDSTSSPIKNIQRMGRTGRKRDGKVLLLFAGNEELKFDKAMAGYEFIQQHIMHNRLITLAQSNRIIPKNYKPIVEKKFIEIPEENTEIEAEEDEDEIIRIATMYMNNKGDKVTKPKSNIKSKSKKIEKRFFMPDNVITGFQNVTNMIKKADSDKSVADTRREKDLLDKLLESDTEDELMIEGKSSPVKNDQQRKSNSNCTREQDFKDGIENINNKVTGDFATVNKENKESGASKSPPCRGTPSALGIGRLSPQNGKTINMPTSLIEETTPEVTENMEPSTVNVAEKRKSPNMDANNREFAPKQKTLGLKRRKANNITDQLKQQYSRVIKPNTANQTITVNEDENLMKDYINNEQSYKNKITESAIDDAFDEADVFDDGLDDELVLIANDKISSFERSSSPNFPVSKPSDQVYKHEFSSGEGLLNQEEMLELYTSYFSILDPADRIDFYDPLNFNKRNSSIHHHGQIGHSQASRRLLQSSKFMGTTSTTTAKNMMERYKQTYDLIHHENSSIVQKITKTDSK
ncbi:ATP-dependent DNA helicase MPH1 [Debaryomyces fabryi]|uniref:ATP-dependent DNA helicase n=1 Tax=Debaryomyces fabryi TaxID=58627 RepID=A0A0V1PU89_9ASCO|nr:ATP-dependent DNA helicase MPH1 [Debaryomyces fabryi]KRZ99820.1 ATP-dependent DNA helicase MPH1 [Debaryomyces fabryi]CUM47889.1 unnamed protein product [Debaryomyces fabryi]